MAATRKSIQNIKDHINNALTKGKFGSLTTVAGQKPTFSVQSKHETTTIPVKTMS
jgi:hypothetical protein